MELLRRPGRGEPITALAGIDLQVERGEFFGILGPNGAGKTTLFKILATLVLPDDGEAEVLGHDVTTAPHRVGRILAPVIADERSLFWRLSGRENLRLFGRLYGLPGSEAERRIEELLHTVDLEEAADRMVGQYSTGLRQRLLIARALLAEPEVLLLDEPTRSLDPISARNLRRFLRDELSRKRGCTVLLATHSADEAFDLCDRIGILDRGRLLDVGRTDDLVARYGDDRYRIRAMGVDPGVLEALEEKGNIADVRCVSPDGADWTELVLSVRGGDEAAARILSMLSFGGASISRFEKVALSLAELIERVSGHANGEAVHADGEAVP
jgi:ABC-2 type transport system ATP-binding protein